MILIKHNDDVNWKSPAISSYADESALQKLLAESPHLLPGVGAQPLAVVRELNVPDTGRIDIVGVDTSGNITLVECKLRANPEIRRQIVGQTLAYAAGIWGMPYEAFDLAFSASTGTPLAEQVRALSDNTWDEETFRAAVTANLSKGRFRLVIAVDKITDELKRTVLYLNQHTNTDTQVLALELGYIADRDVEILVPQTYGEESAQPKTAAASKHWTEETLFQKLRASCTPEGANVAYQLYQWSTKRSGKLYWSNGSLGWVSAQFLIGGKPISLMSIGEWPEGRGVVAVNFEYLRGLIAPDVLQQAANILRSLPGVPEAYAKLEAKDFRQRPNLLIDTVLVHPRALLVIQEALEVLLAAGDAETPIQAASGDEAPTAIFGEQE